jgi:hypothetical protein
LVLSSPVQLQAENSATTSNHCPRKTKITGHDNVRTYQDADTNMQNWITD